MAMSDPPWGLRNLGREPETGTLPGISLFQGPEQRGHVEPLGSCLRLSPSYLPAECLNLCLPDDLPREVTGLFSKGTAPWEQKVQVGLVS